MDTSPAQNAAPVVPNDSADLVPFARALWVGVAGDLVVTTFGGDVVTLQGASGLVPIQVRRVHATGTSAGAILALW